MEVSFGLVTAEAPEVDAKKLAEVLLDNTVDKTRWKTIILQNISKLLNVVRIRPNLYEKGEKSGEKACVGALSLL